MRLFLLAFMLLFCSVRVFAAEQISVQLLWKHQFQFAGYYAAIEKGFYADEGLEVTLKEFRDGLDLVDDVVSGNSQFGVARTSLLIDKNAGVDVVALLAAYQQSPLMLLSLKESGIVLSSDLKGRDIMITNDAKKVGEIIAMMLQAGITLSDFNQVQHTYNIQDLIDGKADAMASYISNEPYQLEQMGLEYSVIHPKDYGFDMYSDILFTSREFIRQHPETTDRFYRASMRGWLYAFEHIEEIAQLIFDQYNSQHKSLDALLYEGRELKKLAFDKEGNFGTLSVNKFNQMAQVYLITGSIYLGYDFSDFIYQPPSNIYRLSQAELAFIDSKKAVRVCVNPDWFPYESLHNRDHQGMIADYLRLIMGRIRMRYEIVPSHSWGQALQQVKAGECDMLAGAMQTVERSRYLNFTNPYLSIPAVVAATSATNQKDIEDMRLGVIDRSAFHEILKSRYPSLDLVGVQRHIEGLRMMQSGKIDGLVGADANLSHILKVYHISDITLRDALYDSWDISMAVRQEMPYLLGILNKSIASISQEQHDEIKGRWLKIEYQQSADHTFLWILLAVVSTFSLMGLYRYLKMVSYNKILRSIAEKDALTGILSRRKLRTELEEFVELSLRHNWTLSLIFFDIDDFKQINDRMGHAVGDRVLVELTHLVSSQSRKTDRFGRWGGEEFLFLMMETDLDNAHLIADKFRVLVSEHSFGIGQPVTCSFGVAQFQRGESIEQWVARADSALYKAKHAGKNCVELG